MPGNAIHHPWDHGGALISPELMVELTVARWRALGLKAISRGRIT
jgi:hypothetical protein